MLVYIPVVSHVFVWLLCITIIIMCLCLIRYPKKLIQTYSVFPNLVRYSVLCTHVHVHGPSMYHSTNVYKCPKCLCSVMVHIHVPTCIYMYMWVVDWIIYMLIHVYMYDYTFITIQIWHFSLYSNVTTSFFSNEN